MSINPLVTKISTIITEEFDQSLPPLKFDRWDFGCAAFNSPMHDNREVVLAVGGWNQATAEVLDYTQTNPAWEESNYEYILSNRRDCIDFHKCIIR